ncbi:COX15/CtaA family protein [Foetidibacter luteolus]|uniref:COX15/CtaA family protein n=1 Tax=Foetidibacter luteolus TaxID=2608880 RepID=UPI00129AAF69|nr:COX15/CtaA family protein [Foetidibacter luteolus]
MNTHTAFIRYTRFVLVFVFLVILAGGVVRTTQSGMGCPDWPRCFGRWVPPTDASQLPPYFEKYLKQQDIDHTFNAYHTWIEYINRLLGALLGVWIFIHTVWSFRKYSKTNRKIFWLSLLLLLATGFQGWLGKKVVDANLAVVKVTTHMLVALVIAAIPLIIIHLLKRQERLSNKRLKWLTLVTLLVLLAQIVLGTEVREQIDEIAKPLLYTRRETWIARLDHYFTLHKIMAWLVAVLCIGIFWLSLGYKQVQRKGVFILVSVLLTIAMGLILAGLNMPAFAQPAHLLMASLLVIQLLDVRLKIK